MNWDISGRFRTLSPSQLTKIEIGKPNAASFYYSVIRVCADNEEGAGE